MIAKAKSNHSLSATINYNLKNGSGIFYTNHLEGDNIGDYRTQLADLQRCYRGPGKSLTIHTQLSPAIEEGKKLAENDWQRMATLYLEKMGLENNQSVGFMHSDKEHIHMHLIINRVSEKDFSLYSDSYIGKKSSKAAHEIAILMGLTSAKDLRDAKQNMETTGENSLQPNTQKPIGSKQIFKAFLDELQKQKYTDIADYFKSIEMAGYEVRKHKNKDTGELRGYGISKNGSYMDASAIDKKFTLKNLSFGGKDQIVKEKFIKKLEPTIIKKQKTSRHRL